MPKPKLQFRIDQQLLDRLKRRALIEHRTTSNLTEMAVRKFLDEMDAAEFKQRKSNG